MTTTNNPTLVASPRPGSVLDKQGKLCPRATKGSYPLSARCECGAVIKCADGTADWVHLTTRRLACEMWRR